MCMFCMRQRRRAPSATAHRADVRRCTPAARASPASCRCLRRYADPPRDPVRARAARVGRGSAVSPAMPRTRWIAALAPGRLPGSRGRGRARRRPFAARATRRRRSCRSSIGCASRDISRMSASRHGRLAAHAAAAGPRDRPRASLASRRIRYGATSASTRLPMLATRLARVAHPRGETRTGEAMSILSDRWIREQALAHAHDRAVRGGAAARRLHQLRPVLLRLRRAGVGRVQDLHQRRQRDRRSQGFRRQQLRRPQDRRLHHPARTASRWPARSNISGCRATCWSSASANRPMRAAGSS